MFTAFAKSALVPLLLRLALAAVFIFHGLALVGPDQGWGAAWNKGPEAPPAPAQLAVAWGELIGGIALAFGFLTRLAAAGIVVIMAGAIATVHWPHGFAIQNKGFEYNFVLIMICLCLMLGGPGPFAVDRVFRLKSSRAR
jgi:putative oxidoreductase